MYHIRTPESTTREPRTWCGDEPEYSILGPWETGEGCEPIYGGEDEFGNPVIIDKITFPVYCCKIPMLTEWEWVKHIAAGHPGICQQCVTAITRVKVPSAADDQQNLTPF